MRRLRARPASVAFETIGWLPPWPTTKSCLRRHAAGAREPVVHGHRLGDRQMLVGRILRRGHRAAVGVAFDADQLLRIVLRQIGGDAPQEPVGARL